jgi:hypothetical protein
MSQEDAGLFPGDKEGEASRAGGKRWKGTDLDGCRSELWDSVDHISDGVDVRHGGLLVDTNDLAILWVGSDSNSFQIQPRGVRIAP